MNKQFVFLPACLWAIATTAAAAPAQAAVMSFTDKTAFDAAVSSPLTTLDFDTFPNGQPTNVPAGGTLSLNGDEFESLGVSLSASGELGITNPLVTLETNLSPNIDPGIGAENVGLITVEFLNGTFAFGADFTDVDLATSSVSLFGVNGNSLGTFQVTAFGELTVEFFGFTSTDLIGEAIFDLGLASGNSTIDGVTIDNLTFQDRSTATPESAPLLGLILALGVSILTTRNRGKRPNVASSASRGSI